MNSRRDGEEARWNEGGGRRCKDHARQAARARDDHIGAHQRMSRPGAFDAERWPVFGSERFWFYAEGD